MERIRISNFLTQLLVEFFSESFSVVHSECSSMLLCPLNNASLLTLSWLTECTGIETDPEMLVLSDESAETGRNSYINRYSLSLTWITIIVGFYRSSPSLEEWRVKLFKSSSLGIWTKLAFNDVLSWAGRRFQFQYHVKLLSHERHHHLHWVVLKLTKHQKLSSDKRG